MGKHHHASFPSSVVRKYFFKPFGIIHLDIGAAEVASLRGNHYFVMVTCQKTRYRTTLFMCQKDDFLNRFPGFILDVSALTGGGEVRRVHSDNGGELIGKPCERWFKTQGIFHTTTGAHAPQQNDISERSIAVVVNSARCMLLEAALGKELWDEAVNTACYLTNRLPSRVLPFPCA